MSSNGFLKEYQQTKTQLGEQLALMQLALAANGTTRLQQYCGSLHERLAANQFNLVVMGQFKRGKSTLINALLGCNLLPTAVVPLTSVVTIVRLGGALVAMGAGEACRVAPPVGGIHSQRRLSFPSRKSHRKRSGRLAAGDGMVCGKIAIVVTKQNEKNVEIFS